MQKKKLSVLIVDDSPFSRDLIKRELINYGCEVLGEAENGKEAIALYKSLKPDFVTMDINMPELNGINSIKEILKTNQDAIIVVVSGSVKDKNEALDAGAISFLNKPFQPSFLWNKIDEFAHKFKERDSLILDEALVEPVVLEEDLTTYDFEVSKSKTDFIEEVSPIMEKVELKPKTSLNEEDIEQNPLDKLRLEFDIKPKIIKEIDITKIKPLTLHEEDELVKEEAEINPFERIEQFETLKVVYNKEPMQKEIIKEETKEKETKKKESRITREKNDIKISISPPRSDFYNNVVQSTNNTARKTKQVNSAPVLNRAKQEDEVIEETLVDKLKSTVAESAEMISNLMSGIFKK